MIENELFVCYTLGTTVDILRQIVLMIAGISVNINLNSVKVVMNWMFCGTLFYGATKNCPEHVRCTRKYLHSGRHDSGTAVQQGLGGRAPARASRNTKIQWTRACARAEIQKYNLFLRSEVSILYSPKHIPPRYTTYTILLIINVGV
jgi:hypothetical protein